MHKKTGFSFNAFFFILASLNSLESWYFSEITVISFVLSTIVRQPELKKKPRSTRTITDHARLVETKALAIECIRNYNNFTMFIDDTKKVSIY